MSQFPQNPAQPGGFPQPGFGGQPAQTKTSGAAIASLIFSLLGCIPGAGLIGVILGIVGISKTRDPRYSGRGLAIVGLVIGLLSLVVWVTAGGGIIALIKGTAAQRDIAKAFVQDLSSSNLTAAQQKCDSSVSPEELANWSKSVQAMGAFKDSTFFGVNVQSGTSTGTTCVVTGKVDFASGSKGVTVELTKRGDVWKITKFLMP